MRKCRVDSLRRKLRYYRRLSTEPIFELRCVYLYSLLIYKYIFITITFLHNTLISYNFYRKPLNVGYFHELIDYNGLTASLHHSTQECEEKHMRIGTTFNMASSSTRNFWEEFSSFRTKIYSATEWLIPDIENCRSGLCSS